MIECRRFTALLRRKSWSILATVTTFATAMGLVVVTASVAQAHGAPTSPGSRTYLCYQDGLLAGGDLVPKNAACSAAVAAGGTQPLWDWFGVLRSDGGGRTVGFIPDGSLCAGGTAKWAAYDVGRADWPVTHLSSGVSWRMRYNAWAAHPGQFRLYVTRDGYDPLRPLRWADLEAEPFSVWNETVPNGAGEYLWDAVLPARKSGRHVIYSVWQRSDSQETFYGCSDVVFDGGSGQVTGIPGYAGEPAVPPTGSPTVAPTGVPPTSVPPTSVPPTTGAPTTVAPTTGAPTTGSPTTGAPTSVPPSGGACTSQVTVSAWSGGYQGAVTVVNRGGALTPWTVRFTLPSGVSLQSGWNGDFTTAGNTVTVTAPSWNRTLAAGAQVSLGFVANGPATPAPNAVRLNGAACA